MKLTKIVIIATILLLSAYDLVIFFTVGNDATLSRVILDASTSLPYGPMIPLSTGVLVGHLFLPQRK